MVLQSNGYGVTELQSWCYSSGSHTAHPSCDPHDQPPVLESNGYGVRE
jgi:hypothetical protein